MKLFKVLAVLVLAAILSAPGPGTAAVPSLTPVEMVGPPTAKYYIRGTNFGPSELVDIYFDEVALKVTATDSTGTFGQWIMVPKTATPEFHYVTAVGRRSGLAALSWVLVGTDWSQFHFDSSHKGYNPYENILSPANVAGLEQLFTIATGGPIDASPAISHQFHSEPRRCYFASRDGKVYLCNPDWSGYWDSFSAGAPLVASPAIYQGKLFLCSTNGKVWAWEPGDISLTLLASTGSAIYAAPAVTASGIFVAAVNGKVYKFDRTTANKPLWAAPAVTGGPINASPTVANGLVYAASGDGKLYAFNNTTGARIWSVPLCVGAPGLASTPAVSNGLVYVGTPNNKLHARDARLGTEIWTFTAGGPIYSSPAVANGRVYFGANDGYLYCLDAAYGTQIWKAYTGGKVYSSPTVANGVVYVGSDSRRVFAFHAVSGLRLWSAMTYGLIRSSPVVADGMLFVTSNDTRFYAYGIDAQQPEMARRKAKRQPPDPRTLVPDPNLKLE